MKKYPPFLAKLFAIALPAAALFVAPPVKAQFGAAAYEVTITNITHGQILSPAIVSIHTDDATPLFTLGMPAGPELAMVAEDASNDALVNLLMSRPKVLDVKVATVANGPILPGKTASITVASLGQFKYVSVVGMLVTTNDAFYAISNVRGPNVGEGEHFAIAYDAGSEANTENCMHIPGPPCGNGGVRVPEGAEGYVHVHAGIHGIADLEPSAWDWRNPVARITIRRLR